MQSAYILMIFNDLNYFIDLILQCQHPILLQFYFHFHFPRFGATIDMEHPSFFYSLFPYFFECVNYWRGCIFFIGTWFWDRHTTPFMLKRFETFCDFYGLCSWLKVCWSCKFALPSLINEYKSLNIDGDEFKLKCHKFTSFLHWLSMSEFIGFIPLICT